MPSSNLGGVGAELVERSLLVTPARDRLLDPPFALHWGAFSDHAMGRDGSLQLLPESAPFSTVRRDSLSIDRRVYIRTAENGESYPPRERTYALEGGV